MSYEQKFFWFFFSQKNCWLSDISTQPAALWYDERAGEGAGDAKWLGRRELLRRGREQFRAVFRCWRARATCRAKAPGQQYFAGILPRREPKGSLPGTAGNQARVTGEIAFASNAGEGAGHRIEDFCALLDFIR